MVSGGGVGRAVLATISFFACSYIITLGQWAYPLALSDNFYAPLGTYGNFGDAETAGVFLNPLFAYVTHRHDFLGILSH